ncbi:hypothetical protein AVEN_234967-1 [Araneus ventricosus]|uniref:Uncharacterized protein n=1 Tax=Araneus ventricosus TaxID=182803 RepID=A0A4Y2FPI1_ARAVE|nr:hypothetical protein AVEN_234967-1 [Araneus ventricosus]
MFSEQSWTDISRCVGNLLWLRETRVKNQDSAMECNHISACGLVCPAPVTFLRERGLVPLSPGSFAVALDTWSEPVVVPNNRPEVVRDDQPADRSDPNSAFPFGRLRRPKHRVRPYRPSDKPKKSIQVYHHKKGMAVLCFRENGYYLTNGMTSHVRENDPDMETSLLEQMYELDVTSLYVTDVASRVRWDLVSRKLEKEHPLCQISVATLKQGFGTCPTCNKNCEKMCCCVWIQHN